MFDSNRMYVAECVCFMTRGYVIRLATPFDVLLKWAKFRRRRGGAVSTDYAGCANSCCHLKKVYKLISSFSFRFL